MSAAVMFWTGFALVVIALIGFVLAVCRAAALGDEDMARAMRQERAARAGVHPRTGDVQPSPQSPPDGVDAPRAPTFSQARGATTSRRKAT